MGAETLYGSTAPIREVVPYEEVLRGIVFRMGMDPDFNLPVNLAAALNEYINTAARYAWEAYPWPDLIVVDEMSSNSFAVPGMILKIYAKDPTVVGQQSQLEVPFRNLGSTVLLSKDYEKVWVEYRRPFIRYEGPQHIANSNYIAGNKVYYGRDYYMAMESTNTLPTSGSWGIIPFPEIVAEYVKSAALAEGLRELGRFEQAEVHKREAATMLTAAIDRYESHTGHTRTFNVALPNRT